MTLFDPVGRSSPTWHTPTGLDARHWSPERWEAVVAQARGIAAVPGSAPAGS
jgi:hypothetical protein